MGDKRSSLTNFASDRIRVYDLNEACQFVARELPIRNSGHELAKLLVEKMVDKSLLDKAFGKYNVDKWLSGETKISRKSVIKTLLLKVNDVFDAECFLKNKFWKDGFYARDYRDIIYMFCLKNSLSIDKMTSLIEKYKHLDQYNADAKEIANDTLTTFLENRLLTLETENELDSFFNEYENCFGHFNRKAYENFMGYYNYIKTLTIEPNKRDMKSAGDYTHGKASVKDVCNQLKYLPQKNSTDLVKSLIEEYDPTRQKLTNIINKKATIPRKYLILLHMSVSAELENHEVSICELDRVLTECGMPFNVIEIQSMREECDLLDLFYVYYCASEQLECINHSAEDKKVIYEIIKLVRGHTMSIMLIASAMSVHKISASDMFARLSESLNPNLSEKISILKEELKLDSHRQTMYQHIANLFDMENFSKDQEQNERCRKIMTNMSIVAYDGLKINTFAHWTTRLHDYEDEYTDFSDIDRLIALRLLQYDESNGKISLHRVISDVANCKTKPDGKKCENYITALLDVAFVDYPQPFHRRIAWADAMELACKRLNENTIATAELMKGFALLNESVARYEVALEYFKKCRSILENIPESSEKILFISEWIGKTLKTMAV